MNYRQEVFSKLSHSCPLILMLERYGRNGSEEFRMLHDVHLRAAMPGVVCILSHFEFADASTQAVAVWESAHLGSNVSSLGPWGESGQPDHAITTDLRTAAWQVQPSSQERPLGTHPETTAPGRGVFRLEVHGIRRARSRATPQHQSICEVPRRKW